jgi:multiple sugar transport system permease protein
MSALAPQRGSQLRVIPRDARSAEVPESEEATRAARASRVRSPGLLVVPFVVLFALFFVVPTILSIQTSLQSPLTGGYVGLRNFRYAIGLGAFWSGMQRVVYFGAVQVVLMVGIALGLALLLDSPRCRGRRLFATIYFLPFAVPGVIASIMWGFLLSPQLDPALGVTKTLGLTSRAANPLGGGLLLYAIILITLWEYTGYNMTLYLASLTSISPDIYDAAVVDGASQWRIAIRIKLPLIRRMLALTVVLSILGALQLFNEPQILANLAPIGSSYTPNLLIYNTAFDFGAVPLAAAESLLLGAIIVTGAITFLGIVRLHDYRATRTGRPK